MTPKALIISLKIDWQSDEAQDVMCTFIKHGSNPIASAYDMIEAIREDFPGHTHIIRANQTAQEINRREVLYGIGTKEKSQ